MSGNLIEEAMATAGQLHADVARYRAALERIVAWYGERGKWDEGDEPRAIAEAALRGGA